MSIVLTPITLDIVFKVVTVLLSFVAIVFTAFQAYLSRKQASLNREQAMAAREYNRLSVRPYIVYSTQKDRLEKWTRFRFELRNYGIGPAKIKTVVIFLDGEKFVPKCAGPIEEIVEACFGTVFNKVIRSSSFPGRGYCVRAGDSYLLLEIDFIGLPQNCEVDVIQKFNRMNFDVTYESFYGEENTFSTRDKVTTLQASEPKAG
jgi:hypothetical protein